MIWRSAASPNSGPFRKSRFLATGMLVPVPGCAPSVLAEESPLLLPVEKRLILAAARAHHLQAGPHRLLYDLLKRAGDANTVTVRQVDLVEPGRVLRTVQNHLNRLEAAGWICRDHGLRTCRNGGWSSQPNTYRVFTVVERSTRLAAAEADADEALEAGEIELATVGPEDPLVRKLCAPSLEEEESNLPSLSVPGAAREAARAFWLPTLPPLPPEKKARRIEKETDHDADDTGASSSKGAGDKRATLGTVTRHDQKAMPRLPLSVCRSSGFGGDPTGATLPGLRSAGSDGSPRCFSKNQVSLRPATVATPGMFEGAGITDTTTRRLSIPVLEEPTCITRMAEGGTPLRISSRRTASVRSTAVCGVSPASLLLLVWTTKIVPLPTFRAALATMSAATGDNAELPGRKNTAALGNLACSSKDFRAMVVS